MTDEDRVFECQAEIRRLRNAVRHLEEELEAEKKLNDELSNDYCECMKMKIGDGKDIVFMRNPDKDFNEVWCYIDATDTDGTKYVLQDIAAIRSAFTVDRFAEDSSGIKNDPSKVEVLVYGNPIDEDYTDKFEIDLYQDED